MTGFIFWRYVTMNQFTRRHVLTVMAVAFVMLASKRGSAGSLDNYDRVQNGMSQSEVESLLGKGTEEGSSTHDAYIGIGLPVSLLVTRPHAISLVSTMPEKVAADIAALSEAAAVCPCLVSFETVDEFGNDPMLIQGWPTGNYRFGDLKPIAGELLSNKDRDRRAVIVGQELAKLKSVKVADTLTIADEKFHVVGIFTSKVDLENGMMIMLLPEAQKTFGQSGNITGCNVNLKDDSKENVDRVAKIIETTIAEANGLKGKLRARPPDQVERTISMVCWKDATRVVCITFVGGKVALKALVRL